MHSLPFAIPLSIAVIAYGIRTERIRLAAAFVFAYLSHLVADNQQLLPPDSQVSPDLLWPLRPPVARSIVPHWAGAGSVNLHIWTAFSVVVLALAAYLLVVDPKTQVEL